MRAINSTGITESEKSLNSVVTLVEMTLDDSAPEYVCNYARNLTVDSKLYVAHHGLLALASITEDLANSINTVQTTWKVTTDADVTRLLDFNYVDKPFRIKRQFVNINDDTLVGNSFMVFDGRISTVQIHHDIMGATATLSVTASSHWTDMGRKRGRHTNDSEQQSHFPSDTCFNKATDYNKEIKWGQA
jgi:hypothetical protein